MEYNGGSYDHDPNGRDSSASENGGYGHDSNSYEPQLNNGQQAPYGQSPYQPQSPYGQPAYGQSPYAQSPYGQPSYGGSYMSGNEGYIGQDATGRIRYDSRSLGEIPIDPSMYQDSSIRHGATGRIHYDSAGYEGGYRPDEAERYERGTTGRIPVDRGATGRLETDRSATGRIRYEGNADERGYGRERTPRASYEHEDTGRRSYGRDEYARSGYGSDDYDDRPRQPRKKKKRSKVSRFFRGLGAYLAQLPTQTLIIFGGSVAVVLVAVILLVVLLPKGPPSEPVDDGQLTLSDITPTPSLAPTFTPGPTPEPTLSPNPDPLNGVTIKTVGEINDVIPVVQEKLVTLGYMDKPADGYTTKYGPATKNGVRLFQIKNYEDSANWDGILGAGTYNLLMSEQAKPFYLARGDGDERTKALTKLVNEVTKLQDRLIVLGYMSGPATGVYGAGTATAIQTFQQYHGLDKDGRAGPATLALIYSAEAMDATTGKANDKSKLGTPTSSGTVPLASGSPGAATPNPSPSTLPAVTTSPGA
ncbi:MAG: peptidoglycan-binding protein [Clostridia bacterium]